MRHCARVETPGEGEGPGRHSQLFKRGNEVQLGRNEPRWLTEPVLCLAVTNSGTLHVLGFLLLACSYSLIGLKWLDTDWQTKQQRMSGWSLKFPTQYLCNPAASLIFIRWFKPAVTTPWAVDWFRSVGHLGPRPHRKTYIEKLPGFSQESAQLLMDVKALFSVTGYVTATLNPRARKLASNTSENKQTSERGRWRDRRANDFQEKERLTDIPWIQY